MVLKEVVEISLNRGNKKQDRKDVRNVNVVAMEEVLDFINNNDSHFFSETNKITKDVYGRKINHNVYIEPKYIKEVIDTIQVKVGRIDFHSFVKWGIDNGFIIDHRSDHDKTYGTKVRAGKRTLSVLHLFVDENIVNPILESDCLNKEEITEHSNDNIWDNPTLVGTEELYEICVILHDLLANSVVSKVLDSINDQLIALSLCDIEYFVIPYLSNNDQHAKYKPKYQISEKQVIPHNEVLEIYGSLFHRIKNDFVDQTESINCWGSLLNHDLTTFDNVCFTEEYKELIKGIYEKISFVYEALVSYGAINEDNEISRCAFRLLIYYKWRHLVTARKEYSMLNYEDNDINTAVQKFTSNNIDQADFCYYLSVYEYIKKPESSLRNTVNSNLDRCIKLYADNDKVRYVESLLESKETIADSDSKEYLTLEDTYNIESFEFEILISSLFKKRGYDAKPTVKSGDYGVDVIAKKGNRVLAIQAKCYPNAIVGVAAIQQVVAGMKYYNANEAYVITNNTFSWSAIKLADKNNVKILDKNALSIMLEDFPIKYQDLIPDTSYADL